MWTLRFKTHEGWRWLDDHGRPAAKLAEARRYTCKGHAKTSGRYYLPTGVEVVIEYHPLASPTKTECWLVC